MNTYDVIDVIRDRMAGQRRIPFRSIQAGETAGQAWITFHLRDGSTVRLVEDSDDPERSTT